MTKATYKVGQTLWFYNGIYGYEKHTGKDVTITKVGRRWLWLSNWSRVAVEDLRTEDGNRRCYLSREAFDTEMKTGKAWDSLREAMRRKQPSATIENIKDAALLLGLEIEA